jgi:uncharacterized repeat protein (TIGR01451 family)
MKNKILLSVLSLGLIVSAFAFFDWGSSSESPPLLGANLLRESNLDAAVSDLDVDAPSETDATLFPTFNTNINVDVNERSIGQEEKGIGEKLFWGEEENGIADERLFFAGKNITQNNSGTYTNVITAQDGDFILLTSYIHNNAAADIEPAVGTKISIEGFEEIHGVYKSTSGPEVVLQQKISSENSTPDHITDSVTIISEDGTPIALESIGILNIVPDAGGDLIDLDPSKLFGEEGEPIGDKDNPQSGIVHGGVENSLHTYTYFQVVEAAPKTIINSGSSGVMKECKVRINYDRVYNEAAGDLTANTFFQDNGSLTSVASGVDIPLVDSDGNYIVDSGIVKDVPGLALQRKAGSVYVHLYGSHNADSCNPNSIVSDTSNVVVGHGNAVLTWDQNSRWLAKIPGAKWIWKDYLVKDPVNGEEYTLSKDFEITNNIVKEATLWISADNSYVVIINGQEVFRDDSETNYFEVDKYDVSQYLETGSNNISFRIKNFPMENGNEHINPAGLLYKLEWSECELGLESIDGSVVFTDALITGFTNDRQEPVEKQGDGTYIENNAGQDEVFPGISTNTAQMHMAVDVHNDAFYLNYQCERLPVDFNIVKKVSQDGQTYQKNVELKEGDTAYFKIFVSNDGGSKGGVNLSDVLGQPTNGGSLGSIENEVISCDADASCSGTVASGIQIKDLAPGKSVSISYQRKVSASGVPTKETSKIVNTASLDDTESSTDSAEVTIAKGLVLSCTLTPIPQTISEGQKSTLSWATQNAISASLNEGIGTVTVPSGIKDVTPKENTTYVLTITGENGDTQTCSASLDVMPISSDFLVDKRVWKGASWGDSANVSDGGIAYYRIAVKNNGVTPGNFVLSDFLSSPTNGGSLGQIFNEDMDCPAGAKCQGSLVGSGVSVTGIPAGEFFVIDYQRVADNSAIPVGETSTVTNTASLDAGQKDTAGIVIAGEGPVPALQVQKSVSTDAVTYRESITRNNGQTAYYKIIVQNTGNAPGSAVVTDTLSSPTDGGGLSGIRNEYVECEIASCSGSLSGSGVKIENLPAGDVVVITYQRVASNADVPEGMNSVVTDTASLSTGDSDTANVTIRQSDVYPSFSIEKTVSSEGTYTENITLNNGGTAQYKVVVTNAGSGAGDVKVSDVLSPPTNGGGLSDVMNEDIQCAEGATCTGSLSGQGIEIKNLKPDARVTITYERTASMAGIPPGKNSVIVDSVQLSSGDSNEASVTISGPDVQTPVLQINKTVSTDGVTFGESITRNNGEIAYYKVIVSSVGSAPGNAVLEDSISTPSNGGILGSITNESVYCPTGATCTGSLSDGELEIENLAPNENVIITYQRAVSSQGIPDGTNSVITDVASLSSGDSDSASVTIRQSDVGPYFLVEKSVSNGEVFTENITLGDGESALYKIVVKNTGTGSGNVTLTDVLSTPTNGGGLSGVANEDISCPSGTTCTGSLSSSIQITNLKPNSSVTIIYNRTASMAGIPPGKNSVVVDSARLSSGDSNEASVTIVGPVATPKCSNFISIPPSVDPNTPFTLNWNSSSQRSYAIEQYEVGDDSVIPYLVNGVETSFDISDGISSETEFSLTIYNGPDQTGESVECPAIIVPINKPSFEIDKLVSENGVDFGYEPIDLADGEKAYYAVVVQNTGTFTGTIGLTDIMDPGDNEGSLTLNGPALATPPGICSSGNIFDDEDPLLCTLKPNGTVTITYSKSAHDDGISPGAHSDFTNTAELIPTGQKSSVDVRIHGPEIAPDLAVYISVDDDNISPNKDGVTQTLTYTTLWYNFGNVDMDEARVTVSCDEDAVERIYSPAVVSPPSNNNTLIFGPFDTVPGDEGAFSFKADLKDGFGDPADGFTCTAHIESSEFVPIDEKETNAENNDDSHEVWVDPLNDDQRFKHVKNLRTEMSGTNVSAMEGDELVYTLGYRAGDTNVNGFIFEDNINDILEYAEVIDAGGGNISNGVITWGPKNISAYDTEQVQFTVRVFDDIMNNGGDFTMTNVYGMDEVIVPLPEIVLSKAVQVNSGPKTTVVNAKAGDILTYTLRAENNGLADRVDFVFEDDISDVLQVSDVIDLGGGELNGGVISWDPVHILSGEMAEKTFQVQIHSEIDEEKDCVLENVYGNTTTVNIPHIVEIKTVINQRTNEKGVSIKAEAGDEIIYVLTVEEVAKEGDHEEYVFVDNVVDTLEYADISNISNNGVLDETTGVITWSSTDIRKGETVDRTFSATIKPENEWPTDGDFELTNIFGNLTTITIGKIVVDTEVEKTVSEDELAPTMEAKYTLTYKNNGDRMATNAFINDDFDETKIAIKEDEDGDPILPVNCIVTETPALTDPIGGPKYIQCQLDDIPANSGAFTIEYTAVVLEETEGMIENTATIAQDQVDEDLSNNTSSTSTPINNGGLVITKTVSPSSVKSGQQAEYTITVTNGSPVKKTFTLADVQFEGNNEGSLSFDNDSSSFSFLPEGSGTAAGTFANGGEVMITDLEPRASVVVTYRRTANNENIPFNQSSMFENIATILETGLEAKAETFVVGPTRGGGGGGGGGGGSRRVNNTLNLYIEKEVQDNQGKWHDADTFDLAAIITSKKSQDIDYRIKVINEGSQTGTDISIEDEFTSTTMKRNEIKNVEGAEWNADAQTFVIDTLRSGKTATITYSANLELLGDFHELASGKNTATITDAEVLSAGSALIRSRKATVEGIGGNDPAFVKTEIDDKIMLQKTVDKKVVKPGEEVEFRIIVHNRGDMDYENLTITDNFAFQFLDLVQANDLRNIDKENQTLTFTKRMLKKNDIWIIKLKVKVKRSVPGNTKVRNSVTITAENADLTGLYAFAEIVVTPLPQPEILIKTGITSWQIALILLGFVTIAFGGRQLRRKN